MEAYAMIGDFQEKFSKRALVDKIKAANITDFTQLWRETSDELCIDRDQALYMYGGRKALAKALINVQDKTIEGFERNTMALYRAQRLVGLGTKTKQLFMLTIMPTKDDVSNRLSKRLVSSMGLSNCFYAGSLGREIGNLPKL